MPESIVEAVRSRYGSVAKSGLSSEQTGVRAVAEAFGYSPEELASIPAEANMGLSCGNPTAIAHLREGETVVDLGAGGGLDVFLAAEKVGPQGRAIGIDMTPEMIDLARRNAGKRQAACCSPSMSKQTADYVLPVVSACCGTPATDDPEHKFHGDLRDLLSHYNVNDYAASVKVFAIKAS